MDKQTLKTIEEMLKADQQEYEDAKRRAIESASDHRGAEDIIKQLQDAKGDKGLIAEYEREKQDAAERNAKDVEDYQLLEARIRVNQRIIDRNKTN